MQAAAILSSHVKSLEFLLTAGRRSRTEIQAFQFAQLRMVVRHAYANVPFYRALYRGHGFHPSQLRSIRDLNRIPTITKSDLVLLEAKTVTDSRLDPHRLIRHSTSGTSGVPTTVYRTWAEERLLNAFRRRSEFAYGLRPGHTVASVIFRGRC